MTLTKVICELSRMLKVSHLCNHRRKGLILFVVAILTTVTPCQAGSEAGTTGHLEAVSNTTSIGLSVRSTRFVFPILG